MQFSLHLTNKTTFSNSLQLQNFKNEITKFNEPKKFLMASEIFYQP